MRGSPGAACFDHARLAAATRSGELGGVVGIDLAGDEYHFNNSKGHVVECFRYAKGELLLNTTVHAGEMAGPDDVRSAIEDMEADRVGQYANATFRAGTLDHIRLTRPATHACRANSATHACRPPRRSSGYAATQDATVIELLRRTQTHLEACPAGNHPC